MKKIYSLLLTAAALLVGTNAWAATFSGNTAAELQDAINAIMSGTTSDPVITLSNDVNLNRTVWVGTQNENDAFKSVTIDLKGHDIKMQGVRNPKNNRQVYIMFSLTHGELKIINSSADSARVALYGETADNSRIVEVFGTCRSSRWNEDGTELQADSINTRVEGWFSHLEIGQNVLLFAGPGCLAEGIAVGVQGKRTYYKDASTQVETTYRSDLFTNSNWGYAQGVRVDFKGEMDIQGAPDGKVYGIATKGLLRSALSVSPTTTGEVLRTPYINTYAQNYYTYNGEVATTNGVTHKLDTLDAPFIYIHPESEIKVRNDGDKVAAIYAAGYAKWLIQGYAEGKTGMYVSSGTVDLQDAYVKSTAEQWQNTSNIGSANGGGSGVVLNSRDSYAGDMEFVVSGDTKIESIDGYAIEEAVNTTTVVPNPEYDPEDPESPEYVAATNVSNITIESGTIVGGNQGAIIISGPTSAATQSTDPEAQSTVVVYGGNVTGSTTVGVNPDGLDDLLPEQGDYHQTEITVGNQTVIVISQGDAPTPGNWVSKIDDVTPQTEGASVKWITNTTDEIAAGLHLKLTELEINDFIDSEKTTPREQTLTIQSGATLEVGRVILGPKAHIIVKAGGKLLVTGTEGIVANQYDNITLESSESAQAIFLFHPEVSSNRQPNATVEFKSKAYLNGNKGVFQRFGVPTWNRKDKTTSMKTTSGTVKTWITQYDYTIDDWAGWTPYGTASDIVIENALPFRGYMLYSNNDKDHKKDYTFEGNLIGNQNENLHMYYGWNYFANSYTAPISIKDLINTVMASLDADKKDYVLGTIYLYKNTGDDDYTWSGVNLSTPSKEFVVVDNAVVEVQNQLNIQPMQAFLMRLNLIDGQMDQPISYKYDVYNPNMGIANNNQYLAPARSAQANNEMHVLVSGEGSWDKVYVVENNNFSNDFENGYDAYKYDGKTGVNLYAMNSDARMEILATDDAEGIFLGIDAPKAGNYTLHVAGVEGMEYAIVDMETNAVINAVNGTKYQFYANAGANDYRFQVVKPAKIPTAIENTEAVKSAKGVYTLTGQFLGNDVNALPAGVYIVNGVKVVK